MYAFLRHHDDDGPCYVWKKFELEANIRGASTGLDVAYSGDEPHVCGPNIGLCSPAVWMADDLPHLAPNTYCTGHLLWVRYRPAMPLFPVGYSIPKGGKPSYESED